MVGNLLRLFIELWAPAVGLFPFELVHYPLAFGLGMLGLTTTILIGQRLGKIEKPK